MSQIDFELLNRMIKCVKREVSFRYAVYPKWVAAGKMTQAQADEEKALMYGIQKMLQKIHDGLAPQEVQQVLLNTELYKKQDYSGYTG